VFVDFTSEIIHSFINCLCRRITTMKCPYFLQM